MYYGQPVYVPPTYYTPPTYYPQPTATQSVPYPILAAFALSLGPDTAPGAPPPLWQGRPFAAGIPRLVELTFTVFAYMSMPYTAIGMAAPVAIRSAHALLNGSPYPGQPRRTLLWIASPFAVRVVDKIRERRGIAGPYDTTGTTYYDAPGTVYYGAPAITPAPVYYYSTP
ncbi:hypothetical protein FRUB_02605 [Fimbriiglobus ruber]|uniref:Uncharacterized protein n=1 Tax=Fimbriiglobus ruber TaxID=1908690 RepID=A0A225DZ19_9BACT|nr:hypothetical protein FRUB_02605 [Fimbriiglobus ruber]